MAGVRAGSRRRGLMGLRGGGESDSVMLEGGSDGGRRAVEVRGRGCGLRVRVRGLI